MPLGQTLVPPGHEGRHVTIVVLAQLGQHVAALVVDGGQRRMAPRDQVGPRRDPRSRRNEALVHEDVDRVRVVHRQELHFVQVEGLPELLGDLEGVAAVLGLQRPAGDLHVLPGGPGGAVALCPAVTHDARGHAKRALPHHVREEDVGLAVPREEHGAGPLEDLLLQVPVRSGKVDILGDPVRPLDAHHVRLAA